jgi:hypothetical protein
MIDNIYKPIDLNGPLKIYGSSKPSNTLSTQTGWFYPLYLTRGEAIQADLDRGGKGIYLVISFFDREGEFYFSESYANYGELKDPFIYTKYDGAGAENPFSKIQNRLSILIGDQLPDFIQSDYTMFVTFLKAYYEFLEQNNQAQEVLQNITKYSDIDETSEEMVKKFLTNYANDVKKSDISDNRLLVKKIRELYSRKGTEEAYKILFNILFKETISFFYPYDLVLKTSSGTWTVPKSLRVKQTSARQNIFDFENTLVVGSDSKATAIVNKVRKVDLNEFEIFEMDLDSTSIKGNFIGGEEITAVKNILINDAIDTSKLTATIYAVISKINVIDGKLGYIKGHKIKTIADSKGVGKYAAAVVENVNRFGSIVSVVTDEPGVNYTADTIINAGDPTEKLNGRYSIFRGVVTVEFSEEHGITKNARVNIKYTGNILSPVDNTNHFANVLSVPNIKTIRFKYPGF